MKINKLSLIPTLTGLEEIDHEALPEQHVDRVNDEAKPLYELRLPSPIRQLRQKVAAGAVVSQFMLKINEVLWRPQDSGRQKVLPWLQALLSDASVKAHGQAISLREHFAAMLVAEDTTHRRHPSQVAPRDHVHSPYAYRLWPDKVQALVVLDRILAFAGLPEAVVIGMWQPISFYWPRLTLVEITTNDDASFTLHFAETRARLKVSNLTKIKFSRSPPTEGDFVAQQERLTQQMAIFAHPKNFLDNKLAPALVALSSIPANPWPTGLATYGLCTLKLLSQVPQHLRGDAQACCAYLETAILAEQQNIRKYIEYIRMPLQSDLADRLDAW